MDGRDLVVRADYLKIKDAFVSELKKASRGQESSLSYLQHTLPIHPFLEEGIAQGIVIGGTNYIVSVEQIHPYSPRTILERKTGILPVMDTKETLLSFLDEHLDGRALGVGVNFGFPLQPTNGSYTELDGILLAGTKEHTFTGVVGTTIGQEIKALFQKKFNRAIPVSVANDTVCLAVAGDGAEHGSMIIGTGVNIGIKQKEHGRTLITNLEVGAFDKFEPSEALQIVDAHSENPGKHLFEKIISGKYLAEVFNVKAKNLGISAPHLTTSQELSALSAASTSNVADANAVNAGETKATSNVDIGKVDREAQQLARALLERSAFLVAAALAGVYDFCVTERIIALGSPLTIIGEGSLLWKGWNYIDNIERQLEQLGVPQGGIRIKHIQNSSINGAIGLLTW